MSFFDNDPFEDIFRELLGGNISRKNNGRNFISGEEEERTIDFIEDDGYAYLIFEIPGYTEKDCTVTVKGDQLIIEAKKDALESVQPYLHAKFQKGEAIRKTLPKFISPKKFTQSMKNGVMEIVFAKK